MWRTLGCGALLAGCLDGSKMPHDSGETSDHSCATDLTSYCELEFGGPCPTFSEASAMTCEGYHFAPAGEGEPVSAGEQMDCSELTVTCSPERNIRSRLWFRSAGEQEMIGAALYWPDDDACGGTRLLGELPC